MLKQSLEYRFGETFEDCDDLDDRAFLVSMARRGSCRRFTKRRVEVRLVRCLCAIALSTPTKSDLQQRDIILIEAPGKKAALCNLIGDQDWVLGAPHIAVFCGNNRRQRVVHELRGHPFANDHFDAVFNASVDAGIALSGFVTAAEAAGLGCCPISAVRNRAADVSDLLGLPDYVFPVAGLAFGYPEATEPEISPRLPLTLTCHRDVYTDTGLADAITAYDAAREAVQPYQRHRPVDKRDADARYGWSEDKARQYSRPERADFGAFLRSKGFKLD